jgi:hypothetical protein
MECECALCGVQLTVFHKSILGNGCLREGGELCRGCITKVKLVMQVTTVGFVTIAAARAAVDPSVRHITYMARRWRCAVGWKEAGVGR